MTSGLKSLHAKLFTAFGFNILMGKKQTPCSVIFPEVQPHSLILNQEIVMTQALNCNSHQLEEQQDVNPSIRNLGLLHHILY